MAVAACATCASKAEPPMLVPSTKRGVIPRYSDSVTVGNWPGPGTPHMPAVSRPSTSLMAMPASFRASRATSAWACRTDIGVSALPSFSGRSATPTITASRFVMVGNFLVLNKVTRGGRCCPGSRHGDQMALLCSRAISRRRNFWIFPVGVCGNSSRTIKVSGQYCLVMRCSSRNCFICSSVKL